MCELRKSLARELHDLPYCIVQFGRGKAHFKVNSESKFYEQCDPL